MTAVNQNFTMYAGDSKEINVTITEAGNIVNLNGVTATWDMKRNRGESTNILSKSINNGISINSPSSGVVIIKLIPGDTENLRGSFHHKLEITDTLSNNSTVLVGEIIIEKA